MYKKMIPAILIATLFAWGCASRPAREAPGQGAQVPPSKPIIMEGYASPALRLGDTWKIYLKASDPESDMDVIMATIQQPGKGGYPPSYTRIRDGNKRNLSGYIYWNSSQDMQQGLNFTNFTLTVQIRDKAGSLSNALTFPLHFQMSARQSPPPQGLFEEKELGPVMIRIQPPAEKD